MPPKTPKQTAPTSSTPAHHTPTRAAAPFTHALIQRVQADPAQITAAEVLQLQATLGNRAVTQLLRGGTSQPPPPTSVAPIQRTVETAAQALFADKHVKAITAPTIAGQFATDHTITPGDLAAIQARVRTLRIGKAAQEIRGKGIKVAKAKDFKHGSYALAAGDLAAVNVAIAAIIATELTPGQAAARDFLATLASESSGVKIEVAAAGGDVAIEVHLDNAQLKHQPPGAEYVIGTRQVAGGILFKPTYATPDWHRGHTLAYMGTWARSLGVLAEGVKSEHGQLRAVSGIKYEGFCMLANGKKYILFHCYPEVGSVYDNGKKK